MRASGDDEAIRYDAGALIVLHFACPDCARENARCTSSRRVIAQAREVVVDRFLACAACSDHTLAVARRARARRRRPTRRTCDCRGGPCRARREHRPHDLQRLDLTRCIAPPRGRSSGPNSSLRVYRSDDHGATWSTCPRSFRRRTIATCATRRFYVDRPVQLSMKAITRLPVTSTRDTGVDSITDADTVVERWRHDLEPLDADRARDVELLAHQGDTTACTTAPPTRTATRARAALLVDRRQNWTPGAMIYGVAVDTPLETELDLRRRGSDRARAHGRHRRRVARQRRPSCARRSAPRPAVQRVRLLGRARRRAARRPGRVRIRLARCS